MRRASWACLGSEESNGLIATVPQGNAAELVNLRDGNRCRDRDAQQHLALRRKPLNIPANGLNTDANLTRNLGNAEAAAPKLLRDLTPRSDFHPLPFDGRFQPVVAPSGQLCCSSLRHLHALNRITNGRGRHTAKRIAYLAARPAIGAQSAGGDDAEVSARATASHQRTASQRRPAQMLTPPSSESPQQSQQIGSWR